MEAYEIVSRYRQIRLDFYKWKYDTVFTNRLMLSCMFAIFTGLAAQIRVYTPFTPVPFTGQVFVVLLSGLVLGSRYGGLSQVIYLGLGMIGVPWFAGWTGGVEIVFGATGGYLVGFVLASLFIGWVSEKNTQAKTLKGTMPLMMAGVAIIYTCGAVWLAIAIGVSLWTAVLLGIVPFIVVDVVKGLMAAGVGRAITVREAIQ
jgi:biotin transport system substrate-specific component